MRQFNTICEYVWGIVDGDFACNSSFVGIRFLLYSEKVLPFTGDFMISSAYIKNYNWIELDVIESGYPP